MLGSRANPDALLKTRVGKKDAFATVRNLWIPGRPLRGLLVGVDGRASDGDADKHRRCDKRCHDTEYLLHLFPSQRRHSRKGTLENGDFP